MQQKHLRLTMRQHLRSLSYQIDPGVRKIRMAFFLDVDRERIQPGIVMLLDNEPKLGPLPDHFRVAISVICVDCQMVLRIWYCHRRTVFTSIKSVIPANTSSEINSDVEWFFLEAVARLEEITLSDNVIGSNLNDVISDEIPL